MFTRQTARCSQGCDTETNGAAKGGNAVYRGRDRRPILAQSAPSATRHALRLRSLDHELTARPARLCQRFAQRIKQIAIERAARRIAPHGLAHLVRARRAHAPNGFVGAPAGRDLSALPARKRGFGIVFQSYSLFPNMTVAENVGYGLRIRGESRDRIAARVTELLALIKLPDYAHRYPHQLSGGQQQRPAAPRS